MNTAELHRKPDAARQRHTDKIRRGLAEEVRTILPPSVSSRGAVTLPSVVGWSFDEVTRVSTYSKRNDPTPKTVSIVHGMLRLSLGERRLTLTPFVANTNKFDHEHTIDLDLANGDHPNTYLGWPDQVLSSDGMQVVGAVLWGDSSQHKLHRDVMLVETGEVTQSGAPSVDTLDRVVAGLRKL